MKNIRSLFSSLACLTGLFAFSSGFGQSDHALSRTSNHSLMPWREHAHVSSYHPVVPGTVAAARDAFFDATKGEDRPLDDPAYHEPIRFPGVSAERPEIPMNESDVAAVVEFRDWDTFITASHRSIYTLVYFSPVQIFKGQALVSAQKQEMLSTALSGGVYRVPSGRLLSDSLSVNTSLLTPGHRYLVFLRYEKSAMFYTLLKGWELRQGTAIPLSGDDVARLHKGRSHYANRSASVLLEDTAKLASR